MGATLESIDQPRSRRRRQEDADFSALAQGDTSARERLIERFLPLATAVARRFVHHDSDLLDDVKQVAALGLVKAVDRYDLDKGTAFSTFAVPTIQGEIRRYFRDRTWMVRPPRDLQELAVRLDRERNQLTEAFGRSPTAQELADRSSCTVEEVIDALEATNARVSESLDRTVRSDQDDGRTIAEVLGALDEGFAAVDDRVTLEPLLRTLSARQRAVLILYLRHDLTQREIGERIGCSQMHVSRLYRGAVARLQELAEQGAQGAARAVAR
jgi:RNA polymerase sigma-B factor